MKKKQMAVTEDTKVQVPVIEKTSMGQNKHEHSSTEHVPGIDLVLELCAQR